MSHKAGLLQASLLHLSVALGGQRVTVGSSDFNSVHLLLVFQGGELCEPLKQKENED